MPRNTSSLAPAVIEGEVVPESRDAPATALALPAPTPDAPPAAVYLASLSPGSRRAMRFALDTIARALSANTCDAATFDWGALRFAHTQAVRAILAEKYSPAMANKCLAALRGTLKAAWRLGHIPTDDYQRAIDIGSVRGQALPRGRALSAAELRAIFATCVGDASPGAARDRALLALLYNTGLRRAEAVALDVGDYDPQSGRVHVRAGKGRKGRAVYANAATRAALDLWIEKRAASTDAAPDGPLFLPVLKNGRIGGRRLHNQSVMGVLAKRAAQAGISGISPHDLRRTFISDLLDAGVDTITVQKMAGHASPATTARYDRRGEEAKQRAADALHIPL